MSEGIKEFFVRQMLKDNDDTKTNLRDITDIILDPEDPIDQAAIAMAMTGVGAPAAGIMKLGNTGRKATKFLNNFILPTKASIKPNEDLLRKGGNAIKGSLIVDDLEELIPGVDGMAKGGLADLPVQHAFLGGLRALIRGGTEGFKKYKKSQKKNKADDKKDTKTDTKKDTKTDTKTDGEKSSLLFSPRGDAKRVGEISSNIIANEAVRSAIRNSLRLGLYGGGTGLGLYGAKKGYDALFGEDEKENTSSSSTIGDPIEPKTFLQKLQSMDPALARALIAGGAKMLQPTEGPVRSFLGLGEFGEGFSESLAQSEAGKSDTQQLYESYLASVPKGQAPLDIVSFANSLKQDSADLQNQENRLLVYLQENANVSSSYTLSDFAVEKKDLAAIGIDYQGEKDPSVDELLLRYSGPERESIINLIVSKSYVKD